MTEVTAHTRTHKDCNRTLSGCCEEQGKEGSTVSLQREQERVILHLDKKRSVQSRERLGKGGGEEMSMS